MSYRSEANHIANKPNYQDLRLTQYPNRLDTRTNNTNMRGFINVGEGEIPDYVMAEYVNALNDGLMAIQRTLGETPMVPHDLDSGQISTTIEEKTVDDRLTRIEDGLFDERYGGAGWQNVAGRPTLSKHKHDGRNGHPDKINLVTEIEGLLRKQNINLSPSTGLTGADILVSGSNQIKINEAIDDSLSKTAGGTVSGDTHFTGQTSSRTRLDKRASELNRPSGVSLVSLSGTSGGTALRISTTGSNWVTSLTPADKSNLNFGRYVIGVRLKTNTAGLNSANILRFRCGSQSQLVRGEELSTNWTQIYWVFNHDDTNIASSLIVEKLASSSTVLIDVDNVFVEPIHPAILDR